MIIGTAGHIDHGKTTLVRALTGVDTDRLPEEKRRGITIDLGFAPLALPDGGTAGVVDVPGHEAFVRTMVAGAAGIDVALVVIAADEGVMPQTREHLAVLDLLGVRHGVVALTKADLVDADWLALVADDVRETLRGTALQHVEAVAVSAATGEGLDALRGALGRAARAVRARSTDDLFRLPVDRAFTIKGTGTVVSGTVWSGTLQRDATVRLMPGGAPVRVRGLHAFGRAVSAVHAGERAAVALAGVDLAAVGRGSALVQGDAWRTTRVLRADITLLGSTPVRPGPRARVRLHLGTSDVAARLVADSAAPATAPTFSARVVTDQPIVARAGDRFVLRAESPAATIGGGVVLDPLASPRARPLVGAERTVTALLEALLADAGSAGMPVAELAIRLPFAGHGVAAALDAVGAWQLGPTVVAGEVRERLGASMLATLRAFHAAHPLDEGAPSGWLRAQVRAGSDVGVAVLDLLRRRAEVEVDGAVVRAAGFRPTLDVAGEALRDALLTALARTPREPEAVHELAERLRADPARVTAVAHHLARRHLLVAVEPDRFYLASAVEEQVAALADALRDGAARSASELRSVLGVTRKFAIPFLEFCDLRGVTTRDPEGLRRWLGGETTASPAGNSAQLS